MEPQDRLDALLSSQPSTRRRWSLPESQREELEPLLEIADDLAAVGTIIPAPSFADDLETRLLARASRQGVATALRDADEPDDAPTLPVLIALDPPRHSAPRRTSARPSWRIWASLAAAILLAVSVATITIAAYASPGTTLYAVRRWQEDARTNLTNSDAERTKLHIQYATDALDALDAAVAQHDPTAYSEALGRFTDELRQADDALGSVPAGADHDTPTASLDDLRVRGRQDLRAALPSIGWPERTTTTRALGALGESVVRVSNVAGVRASTQYGHVWTLTITGSGFQSGAILLVRQRPAGHVVSVTPTQVVAQLISGDDLLPHDIGVGNPDNTAATTSQVTGAHEDDGPRPTGAPGGSGGCSGEHEDNSPPCTPTPTSTPHA
jgi:hypothetical protein